MIYLINRVNAPLLEALAYWIADVNYLRERHPQEKTEIQKADASVHDMFDKLDKMRVPFWIQNSVIAFAESWRRYKSDYIVEYLCKHNAMILDGREMCCQTREV